MISRFLRYGCFFLIFFAHAIKTEEILIVEEKIISTAEWKEIGTSHVLNEERIKKTNPVHPSNILNQIPSVWISRGSGQEHLTSIRSPVLTGPGACGSFLILEDGIPTRPSGFCNVNGLFETNFENAEKLEVIKGPSSARYGSNAMHGLINIINFTNSAEKRELLANYGPDDYFSFKLKVKSEIIDISTSLSKYNGFRDNSGHDQQKFVINRKFDLKRWNANANLSSTNLNQETAGYIYGLDSYKNLSEIKKNTNPEAFRDARSNRASLRLFRTIEEGYQSLSPYIRKTSMEFLQHYLPGTPLEKNSHQSAGLIGIQVNELSSYSLTRGFSIELAKVELQQFQNNALTDSSAFNNAVRPQGFHYDYEVEAKSLALFLGFSDLEIQKDVYLFGDLRLEANHFDYNNKMISGNTKDDGTACAFGGCYYNRPEDRKDSYFDNSLRLGIENRLKEDLTIISQISFGFRPPQIGELYRLQKDQVVSDIDSENLMMVEVGLNKKMKNFLLGLNIYTSKKDNFIFRDANNYIVDDGKTKHRGIELSATYYINLNSFIEINSSLQNHEYDFETETSMKEKIYRGNQIDTAPKILANLLYSSEIDDRLTLELQVQKMGKYFTDAANLHEYSGHTLLNADLFYKITNSLTYYFSVKNLLDERYADRADYNFFGGDRYFPGREREIFVGFNFSL